MKISTALDKIDERQLFVPAFQREYVWKREDAKQLIDSLIKDYPTGTMLVWETDQPPQLKGPHKYDSKQGAVRVLLDGQQRLTTLYMLIRGEIPPYYTAPEIVNDTRGLYVHVETLELEYFKKLKMQNDPRWQNLTDIFQKKIRARDIIRTLEEQGQDVPRERTTLLMTMCVLLNEYWTGSSPSRLYRLKRWLEKPSISSIRSMPVASL